MKDIKTSFLHVFGEKYCQNYSTLINCQDMLALFYSASKQCVMLIDEVKNKYSFHTGLNDSELSNKL